MTNKGGGHMDPLEIGAVQQAMPQVLIEYGAQTSGKFQLAIDRPRTKDRCKAHMRLGEVVPGTEVNRKKQSK